MASPDSLERHLQSAWLARGPLAVALLPLSWLFVALTALRRGLYDLGLLRTHRLDVPVLVVGNLIAGGAGKTPTTLALLGLLRRQGWRPGVVSRGHGRVSTGIVHVDAGTPASQTGDEPLLLHLRGGVPVCVGEDRVAAGHALRQRHAEIDILVCDDGLQHLRLARDAQVIVFDERGAGNGWRLPAGPLRDPMPRRVPARSVVLYNAAAPSTPLPGHLAQRGLAGAVPLHGWWRGMAPDVEALAALRGRPVLAVAGLAQPARFFSMLRERGLDIVEHPLPDHHDYADLDWPAGTADVIVTEKDAVKIRPERAGAVRVWVAALDFRLPAGFEQDLLALLPRRLPQPD
ncbi:MAG: tetraacyldisaccharide 4'-kinase [Piscinibacter sp.]|uniref:tetraacyldisaccharide 4'-kinase n=1 Tax=Piscinibacter sp. TaxID=1903157 RepID=UPI003D153415